MGRPRFGYVFLTSISVVHAHFQVRLRNDFTSTPEQVINQCLNHAAGGGTNFNLALKTAQGVMESSWSTER
jgi:hypothetical protein